MNDFDFKKRKINFLENLDKPEEKPQIISKKNI